MLHDVLVLTPIRYGRTDLFRRDYTGVFAAYFYAGKYYVKLWQHQWYCLSDNKLYDVLAWGLLEHQPKITVSIKFNYLDTVVDFFNRFNYANTCHQ